MALREADGSDRIVHRIGRAPDPLAWTDWRYVGEGRFDGPRRPPLFRALYLAEQRLACFVETLAQWRIILELLVALRDQPDSTAADATATGDDENGAAGLIPADWPQKRLIGSARLSPDQRWPDLRLHETRETLRILLAPRLVALGYRDFDLGDVLGRDRRLTKRIARFAYDRGYQGIVYTSRFDCDFDCWALFAGARFEPLPHSPIADDDPDLVEAARRLRLAAPSR